jgi:hypothetical protein
MVTSASRAQLVIQIGITLFASHPRAVSAQQLRTVVESPSGLNKRQLKAAPVP